MATKRFMSLIKQNDNAEIIREELRVLQGLSLEDDKIPEVPCPYTLFLVASAWCYDLEIQYASGVSFDNGVLDANMGSNEGDNNDGITVIDITEPTKPTYCFVSVEGLEASDDAVPTYVPLSAEQYVRAYYPAPRINMTEKQDVEEAEEDAEQRLYAQRSEEDVKEKIDALRNEPVMSLYVLAEAWPAEYKSSDAFPAEDLAPASTPNVFPSLADLSLKPAVEYAIQTDDTTELEELIWMPGKANLIKSALRDQDPFPDSGLSLLTRIVQHDVGSAKTADLSGFLLSDIQILSLLAEVEDVEQLKLSHNPNITVDGLRQVLSITPKLRRLVLLDTCISDEQIYELIANNSELFHTLEELIHPGLLSWQNPARYPKRFGYVGLYSLGRVASASLAVFTPATLVQCLTDHLSVIADLLPHQGYSYFASSLIPRAIFSSAVRGEGEPWGERRVHCFPSRPEAPFDGQGWLFADLWDDFTAGNRYGFVAKDSEGAWKIYDLAAFLSQMALEGRPAPSEPAIKKLEAIFADLQSKKEAKLWTDEEFARFMQNFTMFDKRYR